MSTVTSIGGIPESWQISELGNVAKWGSGGTPKSGTPAYYGGEIPWAVIGDLTESWVSETAQSITQAGLEKSSAKIIEPGTVLLAMYGASIGRTGISAVEMATNQAIAFAVPIEGVIDKKFLLRYLQSQKETFVRAGQGGAQPNISQTVIKPWPIPIPPIAEQTKIVEILEEQFSRLEAALSSVRSVRVKAAQFSKSLLHAAFAGVLTSKDISAGQIPEGWQQSTLGELVSISNRAGLPAENPILPFVGMEHIESETGKLLSYGDPADYRSSSYIVDSKQVLYGRLRPYLNKVFIPKEESYASREFIPMNLNEDLNQQFLLYRLRSSEFVEFAISLNTGDRPRVKWPQMAEYPICLPPIVEQEKIVETLEEQFSRLNAALAVADEIEKKSSALRRSLLHAAFTGELTKEWREGAHV
jgi:restriction endonuclease S subunit